MKTAEKDYFKYGLLIFVLLFSSGIEFIDTFSIIGNLKDLFFVIVPLVLFIIMCKKKQFNLDINIIFIFLAVFSMVSIIWSIDGFVTLKNSILFIGTTIIAIYIGKNYNKKEIFKILLVWFIFLTFGNLLISVLGIGNTFQADETRYTNVIKGMFKHRNLLGFYMTLGASISLWFMVNSKGNKKLQGISLINLLGSLALLLWSRSMTSILLAALALGLVYLSRYKKFNLLMIYSIVPVLIVSVYTLVYQPDWFIDFLKAIGRSPTLTGRSFIWEGSLKAISYKFLLGFGFNCFWTINPYSYYFVIPSYGWIPTHAHNGYLDLMLDFGIIGTMVALSLFPVILNKVRKLMMVDNLINYKYITYSLVYIVFILIYNLMESPIIRQVSTVYILLVIFTNVINSISKEQQTK